jgi:hypothetical protein
MIQSGSVGFVRPYLLSGNVIICWESGCTHYSTLVKEPNPATLNTDKYQFPGLPAAREAACALLLRLRVPLVLMFGSFEKIELASELNPEANTMEFKSLWSNLEQ